MKRIFILIGIITALVLPIIFFQATAAPALPEVCEHCGMAVTWQPLTEEDQAGEYIPDGHYYLAFREDSLQWNKKSIRGNTCLYLNGKTITGSERAFYITGSLAIMGEGTVQAPGPAEAANGGTVEVAKGGVFSLYGGTITSRLPEGAETQTINGGAVHVQGQFYMYGGTIRGGRANNTGSNVFVTVNGKLFAYGGTVEGDGFHDGVVCRGQAFLSGAVSIQGLWLFPNVKDGGPALCDMLTVRPDFSGNANLYFRNNDAPEGAGIGNADGPFAGMLTCSVQKLSPVLYDGKLYLWGKSPLMIPGENGKPCATWADATAAGEQVVLMDSIADISVDKKIMLDLNGHSITGNITGSGTLLCRDSKTDDYTVADGVYGEVPVSSAVDAREGYLAVEKAGKVSFHRLNLEITGMALRTEEAGMYFTAAFAGDEVIKENIKTFGLTASVAGDPEQDPASAVRTEIDPEQFGKGIEATSTLIRNIIQPGNRETVNSLNAQMPIYGRAYVQLKNGEYIYGSCQSRSLRQQLEYFDKMWSATTTLQQSKAVEFYRANTRLMESWDISKMQSVDENLGDQSPLAALETLEARRDEVESYMRRQMTVLWRVEEPITYSYKSNSGDPEIDADNYIATYKPGEVFSGLPYTHGNNNMETFIALAELDQQGVYTFDRLEEDMVGGGGSYVNNNTARIGNNCADAVICALGRVSSTVRFPNSFNMTPYYGCVPVGEYETVDTDAVRYNTSTKVIADANGEEVMYRAYSQLQKADFMSKVVESGAGHALLVSKVHVVLKNGQIDGKNSYILFHDQSASYYNKGYTRVDAATGLTVRIVGGCDNKRTFQKLFADGWMPLTCRELIDPTPLETERVWDTVAQRTKDTFFDGMICSNYRVAAVTIGISDALGNPLQQCTRFVPERNCEMSWFGAEIEKRVLQGELDLSALPPGTYHYTISCRLYTGREMQVSEGDFQIP